MSTKSDNPGSRVVRKIRVRAVAFLITAAVAGVLAVVLLQAYLKNVRQAGTRNVETKTVVVAAMDVPVAQELEAKHLKAVDWPADSVPVGAFSSVEDVVGQTARQALLSNEPILKARLSTKDSGLAAVLAEGARAMAVKVDQVVGIAGFVQPGDYVDVITTMKPDEQTENALDKSNRISKVSKIILQNIRVLAVGEHMATDGRKPVKVQVVTLEVQPHESERLALASQHGSIQLTMRSRVDQDTVPTYGVTPLALLSSDDEAELAFSDPNAAQETKKAEEPKKAAAVRRTSRRRTVRVRAAKPETEPKKPAQPVVEILRGTRKVEERKLRTSN